jgi:hypothetical protein
MVVGSCQEEQLYWCLVLLSVLLAEASTWESGIGLRSLLRHAVRCFSSLLAAQSEVPQAVSPITTKSKAQGVQLPRSPLNIPDQASGSQNVCTK